VDTIYLTNKASKPCLKNVPYEIPLYLDYWFMKRRALNVFHKINLCKMKHPRGAIFEQILFVCANFTIHFPKMLYVKYLSIWIASS